MYEVNLAHLSNCLYSNFTNLTERIYLAFHLHCVKRIKNTNNINNITIVMIFILLYCCTYLTLRSLSSLNNRIVSSVQILDQRESKSAVSFVLHRQT